MTSVSAAANPRREVNFKTAQMAKLISEIGPDIPEISRRLHQFKESVRYRYKEKILKRGFAIQAIPAYEELGMKRVLAVASFAEDYQTFAPTILTAMSELCYVTSFAGTLPEGRYLIDASVPEEYLDQFADFIHSLRGKGLFAEAEVFTFDLFKNVPMKADYYDFDKGVWDFDWKMSGSGYVPEPRPVRKPFDYIDLLVLKELRIDANQSLSSIALKLSMNYKKLAWHYSSHILPRRLIATWRLNWMGTRYDFKLEKALHRKHRYLLIALLVRDLSEGEMLSVMHKLNGLPFIWSWAAGRNYYSQIALPVDAVNEGFQYIKDAVSQGWGKVQYFVLDQSNALSFTISYKLYDEKARRWTFDAQNILTRFDELMIKIREGAGRI